MTSRIVYHITPYHWPWIGPWLQQRAKDRGAQVASTLIFGRKLDPDGVHKYAISNIADCMAARDWPSFYFYAGMLKSAREAKDA